LAFFEKSEKNALKIAVKTRVGGFIKELFLKNSRSF
jgi:hypothetical protein